MKTVKSLIKRSDSSNHVDPYKIASPTIDDLSLLASSLLQN